MENRHRIEHSFVRRAAFAVALTAVAVSMTAQPRDDDDPPYACQAACHERSARDVVSGSLGELLPRACAIDVFSRSATPVLC